MRTIIVVAVAVMAAAIVCGADAGVSEAFAAFKKQFGRRYANAAEERRRMGIFAENMLVARQAAAKNKLATFGVNAFADMSADEFKGRHNAQKFFAAAMARAASGKRAGALGATKNMTSIDWRTMGAVTHVKDQGQCGSCWSFSTTGGIEGQWFLAGHSLVALSEQELVSCDTLDGGCDGGLMTNAVQWLTGNRGGWIVSEASYPYVSGDGTVPTCNLQNRTDAARVSGSTILAQDETVMATWVYQNGPLPVAVDATSWQTYVSGILTDCTSAQLDHGVLIVGFNDAHLPAYWIVKNSWGANWGESGYIRVVKGKNACLISDSAVAIHAASATGQRLERRRRLA